MLQQIKELNSDQLVQFKNRFNPFIDEIVQRWEMGLAHAHHSEQVLTGLRRDLHSQREKSTREINDLIERYNERIGFMLKDFALLMNSHFQQLRPLQMEIADKICIFQKSIQQQSQKAFLQDEPPSKPCYQLKSLQIEEIPSVKTMLSQTKQAFGAFSSWMTKIKSSEANLLRCTKLKFANSGIPISYTCQSQTIITTAQQFSKEQTAEINRRFSEQGQEPPFPDDL